ncbi:MAG TPA: cupin domain-containing protein [Blastocatellia bacterium]|nr:cupin domain-containing protein [Blastocatellia bacterium]
MSKSLAVMTLTIIAVSAWSYSSLAVVRPRSDAAPPAGGQAHPAHQTITPDAIQWTPTQSGSEIAVLSGNPAQEGAPFVLRIKLRNGLKVPPHWHPIDEHLTVISGRFHIGTGEKFDQAAAQTLPAGSYLMMPREMRHFAWAEGETIIQLHGVGPFKTIWVNPADDPNKKTGATTN